MEEVDSKGKQHDVQSQCLALFLDVPLLPQKIHFPCPWYEFFLVQYRPSRSMSLWSLLRTCR
jgi:hypothetical protein